MTWRAKTARLRTVYKFFIAPRFSPRLLPSAPVAPPLPIFPGTALQPARLAVTVEAGLRFGATDLGRVGVRQENLHGTLLYYWIGGTTASSSVVQVD